MGLMRFAHLSHASTVIPAPTLSFPSPLCHSRPHSVIPVPTLSFPSPLCHSRPHSVIPAKAGIHPRSIVNCRNLPSADLRSRGFDLRELEKREGSKSDMPPRLLIPTDIHPRDLVDRFTEEFTGNIAELLRHVTDKILSCARGRILFISTQQTPVGEGGKSNPRRFFA